MAVPIPTPTPRFLLRLRLLVAIPSLLAAWGVPLEGQLPGGPNRPEPTDTYDSQETRSLLDLARVARTEIAEGLTSYEGRMWEHSYFGVSGPAFRRERGVFDQERVSTIRWSADGNHEVRWEGARRDIPIAGLSSRRSPGVASGMARDLAGDASEEQQPAVPPPLAYDPGSDRIAFGADWALNPLADTAAYHYRFRGGDTLTVQLPGDGGRVVLAEVLVEPRRTDFRLLSASLWFDVRTGHLVRAGYRPARPFDLEVDAGEDADLPPGFLRPIRAEIHYVTVDHGLYDLRWWIPRRFTFEGEGQVTAFLRFPLALEWLVEEIRVNEPGSLIPDELPEGWRQREALLGEEDEERRVIVLVPTVAELRASPYLVGGGPERRGIFTEGELRELRGTLDRLGSVSGVLPGFRFAWGSQDRLTRYNRVEGLSVGVASTVGITGAMDLRGEVRYGVADGEVGGDLRLRHGPPGHRVEVGAYRALRSSSEWATPESLTSSLASLLWGGDHTPFHRALGAEFVVVRESRSLSQEARLFVERHSSARRETHAHLSRLWTDRDLRENPEATEGRWAGASLRLRWEAGASPERVRAFGTLRGEGAGGTSSWSRGWMSAGVLVPLGRTWGVAMEGGAGGSMGDLPAQRHFFPGGPEVFRGYVSGEVAGESFWFGRLEVGPAVPVVRAVGFVDLLGLGDRHDFPQRAPAVAIGAGLSLLDGLFRLDAARMVRGGDGWRVMLYSDGLF